MVRIIKFKSGALQIIADHSNHICNGTSIYLLLTAEYVHILCIVVSHQKREREERERRERESYFCTKKREKDSQGFDLCILSLSQLMLEGMLLLAVSKQSMSQ